MSYTPATYTGDGSTTTFAIPFPYQSEDDVEVTVDGEEADFTFSSSSVISFSSAPSLGAKIYIKRNTGSDSRLVVWNDAVALTAEQLNAAVAQIFYMSQEAKSDTSQTIKVDYSGNFFAQSKRITGLADPEDDQDAVTKGFVEDYLRDSISNAGLLASTTPNDSDVEGDYVDDALNQLSTDMAGKASTSHTHDDRYYTESEIDSALAGKSDTSHTHDDRYYTESEIDALLSSVEDTTDDHEDRIEALEVDGVFESSPQAITRSALLILPHGLGSTPRFLSGKLVNISGATINGWADGEGFVVSLGSHMAGDNRTTVSWADGTNVYVRFANKGDVFSGGHKTDGTAFNLTNTDWNLIVYAF